ncbi:MAG: hypothetical protein LN588_04110 [Rickettsia endosymbiont of Bryobia graminum]|nr:hypothetical protein [Rickettsia endosymbiont of Bryobia graminum]
MAAQAGHTDVVTLIEKSQIEQAAKNINTELKKQNFLATEGANNITNTSHSQQILQRRASLDNEPKKNIQRTNSFSK